MSRISEIEITTTQVDQGLDANGKLSRLCPNEVVYDWLDHALHNILSCHCSGTFRMRLNASGSEVLVLNKEVITAIAITLG